MTVRIVILDRILCGQSFNLTKRMRIINSTHPFTKRFYVKQNDLQPFLKNLITYRLTFGHNQQTKKYLWTLCLPSFDDNSNQTLLYL
jgi:hypothetical protein